MGALLISSLIIFPALTAMRLCRSFRSVVLCSAVVSVVCFVLGMTASYALELPSGASVVIVNIIAFLLFSFASLLKRRAWNCKKYIKPGSFSTKNGPRFYSKIQQTGEYSHKNEYYALIKGCKQKKSNIFSKKCWQKWIQVIIYALSKVMTHLSVKKLKSLKR